MKIFFFIVIVMHSLIHMVGFIKSFNLIELSELTNPIPPLQGILWLLTSVLFLVCLYGLWYDLHWWWMLAIPAVLLSQILIFLDWNEAWFGSIANLIVVLSIVLGYGQWKFDNIADAQIAMITALNPDISIRADSSQVGQLPEIVQKWLNRSGALNQPLPRWVEVKQSGKMRTSPTGRWMDVTAKQWFNVYEPSFVWRAHVRAFPGVHLSGLDSYQQGQGRMWIQAMSLFTVVDSEGPEIDQGTMLRFMGEMAWFPAAAVLPYIQWEEAGEKMAKATMNYRGVAAEGIFQFSDDGDLLSFRADRYYDRNGQSSLEDWIIETRPDGWKEFDGRRLPFRFIVSWNLEEGKFSWYELELTGVQYHF